MWYWIIVITLLVIWFRIRKRDHLPGPHGLPIVGYLPWLNSQTPHISLTNLSKKYGSVYGLFLGSIYTVVLTDHKLIRKVLAKEITTGRAPLYLTHGIMKGYGLICAEKDLWKDQRKFVYASLRQLGAFRISCRRKNLESRIREEISDLINYVKEYEERNNDEIILNPSDTLKHNLGSVINQIVFGQSFSRDDKLWKWLLYLQEEGTKYIGVAGPLNFLPFLRFIPYFKSKMTFIISGQRETHKVYMKIISEQAEILRKLKENDKDFEPENILQAFLIEKENRAGKITQKYYNNEQFVYLLADLFGAGLDTTLATLRWYLLYMANFPKIQETLQEEIDYIIGHKKPSFNDLNNMPYAEACLAEIQRIRSVVPTGIPHGALEEFVIDGYRIPKGTMIVPLQWAVHMNEEIWKSPENFNPGRFLDEEGRFIKNEALIPFQTGKRMCVGDELAKMILFLFTTTIFQEFFISPVNNVPLDSTGECGITLTPKEYKLVFRIREEKKIKTTLL